MPNFVTFEAASRLLPSVTRISVVGVSGVGKSTLSQGISASFDLPHISLDRDMRWLPGWALRDRDQQRVLHDGFVAGERWVIDGTNISFMDTRLPRSDLLIWLRLPRRMALFGIARRVASGFGRVRPDMADGCPEKLPDLEFLRWIWTFEQRQSPRLVQTIDSVAPALPVLVVSSLRERRDLTALLSARSRPAFQERRGK